MQSLGTQTWPELSFRNCGSIFIENKFLFSMGQIAVIMSTYPQTSFNGIHQEGHNLQQNLQSAEQISSI